MIFKKVLSSLVFSGFLSMSVIPSACAADPVVTGPASWDVSQEKEDDNFKWDFKNKAGTEIIVEGDKALSAEELKDLSRAYLITKEAYKTADDDAQTECTDIVSSGSILEGKCEYKSEEGETFVYFLVTTGKEYIFRTSMTGSKEDQAASEKAWAEFKNGLKVQ